MAVPKRVKREVEFNLHNVNYLLGVIKTSIHDIVCSGYGYGYTRERVQTNNIRDSTADKAILLIDGTPEMQKARKWLKVINENRLYFEGTPEGEFMAQYFGKAKTQVEVGEELGASFPWTARCKVKIVAHCAMLAASEGLFTITDFRREEYDDDSL